MALDGGGIEVDHVTGLDVAGVVDQQLQTGVVRLDLRAQRLDCRPTSDRSASRSTAGLVSRAVTASMRDRSMSARTSDHPRASRRTAICSAIAPPPPVMSAVFTTRRGLTPADAQPVEDTVGQLGPPQLFPHLLHVLAVGGDLDIGAVPVAADEVDAAGQVGAIGADQSVDGLGPAATRAASGDRPHDQIGHLVEQLVGTTVGLHVTERVQGGVLAAEEVHVEVGPSALPREVDGST